MLRRAIVLLLLAGVLCAAALPAVAVSVPWSDDKAAPALNPAISLDLRSAADALAAAGNSGFDGLLASRPTAGQSALAALIRTALGHMPWLADAKANGLWSLYRNPAVGVAIYGPGVGGYSSFSWTRQVHTRASPLAVLRNHSAEGQAALLLRAAKKGGAGSGGGGTPTAVPLPPGAILLGTAIAAAAAVGRRRRRLV